MRLSRRCTALLAGLMLALAPTGPLAMVIKGSLKGPRVGDMAVANHLAFVTTLDGALLILDIEKPEAMVELNRIEIPGLQARSVAAHGTLLFVDFGEAPPSDPPPPPATPGLRILDITDPANPTWVSLFEHPPAGGLVRRLSVSGGRAYLGSLILDVSDPTTPALLGVLPVTHMFDLAVVDGLAYVSQWGFGGDVGLRIFDVSDPTTPVEVGHFYSLSYPRNFPWFTLSVSDGVAYLVHDGEDGRDPRPPEILAVDVSNPAEPALLATIPIVDRFNSAFDVAVRNQRAFITSRSGLRALDVTDPTHPVQLGELGLSRAAGRILLSGDTAYIVSELIFNIVDVSRPEWPVARATSAIPGDHVAAEGSLAYISSYGRLHVVDASDPEAPTEIGSLDGPAGDVVLRGDFAFVASDMRLRIVDVSEPSAPREVGAVDAPAPIQRVALQGSTAYLAYGPPSFGDGGLLIVDVSKAAAPAEIGRYTTSTPASSVDVVGGIAYLGVMGLSTNPAQLVVIDVSDPTTPLEIGRAPVLPPFPLANRASATRIRDIVGDENWLYAVVDDGVFPIRPWSKLVTFDVSNPAAPAERAAVSGELLTVFDLALDGDRLYLADSYIGPRVFDVSNPASPFEIGAIGVDLFRAGIPQPIGVALGNGLAYVINRVGLTIVDFGPEYADPIRIGLDVRPGSQRNPLQLANRGVIPVAILGALDFDATQVDPTSLRFGPDGAAPVDPAGGHAADVNGDGLPDWLSHYRTKQTGIAFGDTEVCARGTTTDGVRFEGCDRIDTLPSAISR